MTERILVDTGATLSVTFYADGLARDADGIVNVTVVDAAGATLQSGDAAAGAAGDGKYTFTLNALEKVNQLVVTWTGVFSGVTQKLRTRVEIVGGFYFTVAQLLNEESQLGSRDVDELVAKRTVVEQRIEGKNGTGVAWVPRYGQARICGEGGNRLFLDITQLREVLWCRVNGATVDVADLTVHSWGAIDRASGWWSGTIEIGYSHGHDAPPEDLVDAALTAAATLLFGDTSGVSPRALSLQNDFGNIRYSTAGDGRCFGLPDVDAVIASYAAHGPMVL